jgi:methyl-accepting chemotaxis protein
MEWASIVWQVGLGLMLFALSILFLYLCAVLNSIRKNLSSIERLTSQEVGTLLKDIDQMVKVLNSELPQLLKNINEIAVSLDEISKSELQPITHNIQEVTGVVNQNISKIDELVDVAADFSHQTIKRAELYRDQLSIPITDIISLWSGIKAGWEAFRRSRKQEVSDEV